MKTLSNNQSNTSSYFQEQQSNSRHSDLASNKSEFTDNVLRESNKSENTDNVLRGSNSGGIENDQQEMHLKNMQRSQNQNILNCEVVIETSDMSDLNIRKIVNLNVEEMYKVVFRNGLEIESFSKNSQNQLDSSSNNEIFMDLANKVGS